MNVYIVKVTDSSVFIFPHSDFQCLILPAIKKYLLKSSLFECHYSLGCIWHNWSSSKHWGYVSQRTVQVHVKGEVPGTIVTTQTESETQDHLFGWKKWAKSYSISSKYVCLLSHLRCNRAVWVVSIPDLMVIFWTSQPFLSSTV